MIGLPLAVLEDGARRGDPWQRPSFARGTEQPVLERDESLLVRITDCTVLLESRTASERDWQAVWRSHRPGQATVTDRRVVVGCRQYQDGPGRALIGPVLTAIARATGLGWGSRCLGGHFRYEWVTELAVAQGMPGHASRLMLTVTAPGGPVIPRPPAASPPGGAPNGTSPPGGTPNGGVPNGRVLRSGGLPYRGASAAATAGMVEPAVISSVPGTGASGLQWRLTVGSLPATAYLPDLAALVANHIARVHRRGAGRDEYPDQEAELAAAQGWPGLRPGPGKTGSVWIPGACPLGTRPIAAGDHAWRA